MTIKVDRVPAAEHLLILLDKNSGKKETGMVDPKNLGKTETIGTIINKGFKVPAEYEIGERVYLPLNQQQHLFEYGGNSFCMIHYSYITVFMSDEYEVDLSLKAKRDLEYSLKNTTCYPESNVTHDGRSYIKKQ